jgi:hypothetical protein
MFILQGNAKGVIQRDYQQFGISVPLLSSFYFRYENARPPGFPPGAPSVAVDNHVRQLQVLPGGVSRDLSPNADLSPSLIADGKIDLGLADKDPTGWKDRYFFKVAHTTFPPVRASRFQFRDLGDAGKSEQILPPPPPIPGHAPVFGSPIFVLVGFRVFFLRPGEDRHIRKLAVLENDGKLTVEFRDQNAELEDNFGYLVDYAWVWPGGPDGPDIHFGEESGSARGGAQRMLPTGEKVIRGFSLTFRSHDHHCREIGVLTSNDNIQVYYGDENADDPFLWTVRWASIGNRDVLAVG